jgi:membrane protein DedA with SNARE-associated domain
MELLGFSFQTIDGWIEAGGYIALFGLLFCCGLGLPLPEDIPLMIAGALVAKGKMNLAFACTVAWLGIMGGDVVLYHLGKKFGLEITRVPFIGKHVTRERIQRVEEMFAKYGIGVVAIGRMFAGVRGAMVVAAGAIKYNFWKFFIADGLAAIVSGGFFVFVGHWLGTKLNENTIKEFKWWFIGTAVLLAIGFIGWILWRRKKAVERVEKVTAKVEQVAEAVAHAAHLHSEKPEK